jgi:hypothetical protein
VSKTRQEKTAYKGPSRFVFLAKYHQSSVKSRRKSWEGHVARMKEKSNAYRILVGKHEGGRLEDLHEDGRMLKQTLNLIEGPKLAQEEDNWQILV